MLAEESDSGWDPFADPADTPSVVVEAWNPRLKPRKPAAFAFPFPESEGESDGESSSSHADPLLWGEDPALEALSGSMGHLVAPIKQLVGANNEHRDCKVFGDEDSEGGVQQKAATQEEEEEPPVVIDDADLGPRTERLLLGMQATGFEEFEIFGDVLPDGELRDLALQACVISRACFVGGGTFRMTEGRHLALLVNTVQCVTVGYCLYSLVALAMAKPRTMVIEELAISAAQRLRGLGTRLLQWLVAAARTERCPSVAASTGCDLERFLRPLGFQVAAEPDLHSSVPRQEQAGYLHWRLELEETDLGPRALESLAFSELLPRETAKVAGAGLPEIEALAGKVRLICFLASHISSKERLERLADTLLSIAMQEPYGPPEVFMSWSASTGDLQDQTRALLKGFSAKNTGFHVLEQEVQMSQFLHHAAALRKTGVDLRADGWVIFSDDDDLWHPRRYFEFLYAASEVHENTSVKSVAAFGHAQLQLNVEPRAVRPKDVDKLLMQGPLVCTFTDAERKATDIPEYFDVAVRCEQFKHFLLRTPRTILASKFCDRRFVLQFSVQGWGVAWFRPASWLYYYSRADGIIAAEDGSYKGGASFAVSMTEADHRVAARHERSRPLAVNHPVSHLSAEEVVFLVASFRASIEEQVITLESLNKGWVKAEQLRVVCEMAVQSRSGIQDADRRLWDWGVAVAWELAQEVCKSIFVQILE